MPNFDTRLSKPVYRFLSPETAQALVGSIARRKLLIEINAHGITFRAQGRHRGVFLDWEEAIKAADGKTGASQLRKDLK